MMDWPKILTNLMHLLILFGSAYAAYNPKWAWAVPAFTAWGQMSLPPDLRAGWRK